MTSSGKFRVVLHVAGIAHQLETGEVAGGFYANIVVHASSEAAAVERALSTLRQGRRFHLAVRSAKPTVEADFVERLAGQNTTPEGIAGGFVFYQAHEAPTATATPLHSRPRHT